MHCLAYTAVQSGQDIVPTETLCFWLWWGALSWPDCVSLPDPSLVGHRTAWEPLLRALLPPGDTAWSLLSMGPGLGRAVRANRPSPPSGPPVCSGRQVVHKDNRGATGCILGETSPHLVTRKHFLSSHYVLGIGLLLPFTFVASFHLDNHLQVGSR